MHHGGVDCQVSTDVVLKPLILYRPKLALESQSKPDFELQSQESVIHRLNIPFSPQAEVFDHLGHDLAP